MNKEETEQEAESFRRKYYDALTQFGDALNIDTEGGHMENAVEALVEKVSYDVHVYAENLFDSGT